MFDVTFECPKVRGGKSVAERGEAKVNGRRGGSPVCGGRGCSSLLCEAYMYSLRCGHKARQRMSLLRTVRKTVSNKRL